MINLEVESSKWKNYKLLSPVMKRYYQAGVTNIKVSQHYSVYAVKNIISVFCDYLADNRDRACVMGWLYIKGEVIPWVKVNNLSWNLEGIEYKTPKEALTELINSHAGESIKVFPEPLMRPTPCKSISRTSDETNPS